MPPTIPQPVVASHTSAAMSLVVTVNAGPAAKTAVRALCGDLAGLLRAVGFRDLEGRLSCIMAFGSDAWDRLFGDPRPKELHQFREIRGQHHAVATPGDILFHIRSARMDLCFELATQIMARLSGAVSTVEAAANAIRDLIGQSRGGQAPRVKIRLDVKNVPNLKTATIWGSLPGTSDMMSSGTRTFERLISGVLRQRPMLTVMS